MSVGSTKGPQLFALPRQPLAQLGVEIDGLAFLHLAAIRFMLRKLCSHK